MAVLMVQFACWAAANWVTYGSWTMSGACEAALSVLFAGAWGRAVLPGASLVRQIQRALPALLFAAALVLKQLWCIAHLELGWSNFALFVSTLTSLLSALLLATLPAQVQWIAAFLFDGMVSLVFLADILHFRIFSEIPSIGRLGDISALQNGAVLEIATSALRWNDAWLALDLPLLLLGGLVWGTARAPQVRFRWAALGAYALIHAISLSIDFDHASAQGHRAESAVGSLAGVLTEEHSAAGVRLRTFRSFGPLVHHALNVSGHLPRRIQPSDAELSELRTELVSRAKRWTPPGPLWGTARGLNVIMVQMESLPAFALDLSIDGHRLMPGLARFAQESLHFDDFYTQVGAGMTADASFLVNCSLYPFPNEVIYSAYVDRAYRCLPRILGEHGYHAFGVGGHPASFMQTEAFHLREGFERQYGAADFVEGERASFGIADKSFLPQAEAQISAFPRPFYAFVSTVSNHVPYTEFGYSQLPLEAPIAGSKTELLLNAIRYSDEALERFLSDLEKDGLLDESIVVLYGDHWPHEMQMVDAYPGLRSLLGCESANQGEWFEEQRHIPMMIHFPHNMQARSSVENAGQLDVEPTILGLLGIEEPLSRALGRDVLRPGPDKATIFPNGAVLDAQHVYLPSQTTDSGSCFSRPGDQPAPLEACLSLSRKAEVELELSGRIVRDNLYSMPIGEPAALCTEKNADGWGAP